MPELLKKLLVILANIPPALGITCWPLACFVSLFFFDAPGAVSNILAVCLGMTVWLYPVPVVIGIRRVYKAYRAGDYNNCVKATLLAYSGLLAFAIMFGLIKLVCGGRFAC